MRKGFTIIELLVAIGILAVLLAASGVIFSMAVEAQQTAKATGEITEKLRTITDRLNTDFSGIDKSSPVMIWFELDTSTEARYDQMMFFVDSGDNLSSTRQYNDGTDDITIEGTLARIYYGQADKIDYISRTDIDKAVVEDYTQFKTLARRQHIITTAYLGVPVFPDTTDFINTFIPFDEVAPEGNDYYEYDTIANLAQWQTIFEVDNDAGLDINPVNAEHVIQVCFDSYYDSPGDTVSGRAGIDLKAIDTLHMLFSQGVGSFSIQWAYMDPVSGQLRWFPSVDPNGDGSTADSNFTLDNSFGILFYDFNEPVGAAVNLDANTDDDPANDWQLQTTLPDAFKFTFTLYDSKMVFKEGKTFTHIVYLN